MLLSDSLLPSCCHGNLLSLLCPLSTRCPSSYKASWYRLLNDLSKTLDIFYKKILESQNGEKKEFDQKPNTKFQDFSTPPVLPTCEVVEKQKSSSECPPLQMFSSEIVSHYGITQLAPTAETEGEIEDEVKKECITVYLHCMGKEIDYVCVCLNDARK